MTAKWAVEQLQPTVHKIRFDGIATGWKQAVLLSADQHIDNPLSDRALFTKHLQRAKELNAPVVFNGDLFDAMQGPNDPRGAKSATAVEFNRDDYFDALVDNAEQLLAPYAGQIAVLGQGNHETSVVKHHGTSLVKRLAHRLKKHTGQESPFVGQYAGWVIFQFTVHSTVSQTVRLKFHHGGVGGEVTKGVIGASRRAVYLPDANIVCTGHLHEGWYFPISRERIGQRGIPYIDTQHHIQLPTYKEEYLAGAGYHVQNARPPKPIGAVWLEFYLDQDRIRVRPIHELKYG